MCGRKRKDDGNAILRRENVDSMKDAICISNTGSKLDILSECLQIWCCSCIRQQVGSGKGQEDELDELLS